MELHFPQLKPWQKDVYDDIAEARGSNRTYVVKSKRQVGKTALATIVIIKYAVDAKSSICLIEPTLAQSRRVFKQIGGYLKETGLVVSQNASTLTMELSNGSEVIFKSSEQGDSLRGMTLDLLIIDEGAFIPADIYELLMPSTDAHNAPVLVISTPLFEDGKFFELFKRGLSDGDKIRSYDWSKYDTSCFLSNEKLEYYRSTLSPNKFRSEYLGEFITDGSFVFGDVRKCIGYTKRPSVYCGIDWGSGNEGDSTVVTMMDEDGAVTHIDAFNYLDAVEQIERIAALINREQSLEKVVVEMNSIGRVFYDHLVKKVKAGLIKEFTTTNESKRRIIEQLVTAFQTDKIKIPRDKDLITQLQHYAVEKTSKGYTYNGITGYNDDYVMSLAFAYDCTCSTQGNYKVSVKKRKKYDPHPLITKYG